MAEKLKTTELYSIRNAGVGHDSKALDFHQAELLELFEATELTLPTKVDRFHLSAELARGGMGVIYHGYDPVMHRYLALKTLLPVHAVKPNSRQQFLKEVYVTARLEHPGVVPVYETGILPDGRPYYTTRVIPGETLAGLLERMAASVEHRPRLLKLFEQVCQTMAFAHSRGVIHRDLKPANILAGPFGVVKVIDWGVSKVLTSSPLFRGGDETVADVDPGEIWPDWKTQCGLIVGTLEYMSPEQVSGDVEHVDARSDVFALGAILCEILTGHPAYRAETKQLLLAKARASLLEEAYTRLDKCGADPQLISIAIRCLAVNPAIRPASAIELSAEFTAYLESDLRRAERDLVRFFELSLDLFCIANLEGYFTRVNVNFTRVLGYDMPTLLAQPFLFFVHEEDRAKTLEVMADLSAGVPVVRFRNRYRDVNGQYRWFEWTAKSVPEESIIFAVARDVPGERDT